MMLGDDGWVEDVVRCRVEDGVRCRMMVGGWRMWNVG